MSCVLRVVVRRFIWKWSRNFALQSEATFETKAFTLHKLTSGPKSNAVLTRNEALEYYYKMLTIRKLENKCANLYRERLIRGFCHLSNGQEAVAVGIASAMRPQDTLISSYRIHGLAYVMGISLRKIVSELTGKKTGICFGKGGSMHLYCSRFFGGCGIVGAQVPVGVGLALALKYLKTGGICFTMYGDGAANQGQVFESFNMAKLWNLPVVFICENNGFGMGTSTKRSSAVDLYYTRGDFIPGIRVDGMDVVSIRESIHFAIEHILDNKGPILVEMVTYRFMGHSMSDPGKSYRNTEEVNELKKNRDPINLFEDQLLKTELATEEDLKGIKKKVQEEVQDAVNHGITDEEPEKDQMTADIYMKAAEKMVRGSVSNEFYIHSNVNRSRITDETFKT